jgi:hypothetical protein
MGTGGIEDIASVARADINGQLGSTADAAEIGSGEFPLRLSGHDIHGWHAYCSTGRSYTTRFQEGTR